MAQFELQMKYATPPMVAGIHTLALLFPVWGIMIPTGIVLFIVLLLRLPANIPLFYSLTIIVGALLLVGLSALIAFACDDTLIKVNKDGITFPLRFWPALQHKNQRPWQELKAIKLNWQRGASFQENDTMTLVFLDGAFVTLNLQHVKQKELEQFFIAFEACALHCERDADLPDLELAVQHRGSGPALSCTELWEKSLSQRFSGATFVPLDPDTTLQTGRYRIVRQLAFGGFAAIYLARETSGQLVVLKEACFPQSEAVQSKASELFQREAALLSKLSHPNVARMHDYFVENSRHYLVMEHIDGLDLNRLVMQRGPQKPDTVTTILRQVAAALEYLHQQSPPIVHRDLTPDNLLLKQDGSVVLIDFGAAKEIVNSFTGTIIGKQAYIAPEQFRGKPTPKSDIYSLGATLFFLLTGKQPEPLSKSDVHAHLAELDAQSSNSETSAILLQLVPMCTEQDETERADIHAVLELLKQLEQPRLGQAPDPVHNHQQSAEEQPEQRPVAEAKTDG